MSCPLAASAMQACRSMWVRLERELRLHTRTFDHPREAGRGEWGASLRGEDKVRFRLLFALQPPQHPQFIPDDWMGAVTALLDPADVQGGRGEVDLVPAQVRQLARPEAVAVGHKDHRRVPVGPAVAFIESGTMVESRLRPPQDHLQFNVFAYCRSLRHADRQARSRSGRGCRLDHFAIGLRSRGRTGGRLEPAFRVFAHRYGYSGKRYHGTIQARPYDDSGRHPGRDPKLSRAIFMT